MSGTVATSLGVFLYMLVSNSPVAYLLLTSIILVLGFWVCGPAEKIFGQKDSSRIVIDEVAGVLLAFFLIPPKIGYLVLGFLLFRLFDVLKPQPIKRVGLLDGSLGIMSDDILAALCTNILLQVVSRCAS